MVLQRLLDQRKRGQLPPRVWVEPPMGIEPMTYSLRGFRRPVWHRRQRRKPLQHNKSLTTALVGLRRRMAKIRPSDPGADLAGSGAVAVPGPVRRPVGSPGSGLASGPGGLTSVAGDSIEPLLEANSTEGSCVAIRAAGAERFEARR